MDRDKAVDPRLAAAKAQRDRSPFACVLARLFGRREVLRQHGWRFTLASFRGREFLLDIEEP